jgi:glycosyltransferase involved in cell wall biosynthesis
VTRAYPIAEVAVVVPAKDEEELLPRCLSSVHAAVAALADGCPDVRASVTVVLDGCRDGSAAVVAGWPSTHAVEADAGNAGGARDIGVRRALAAARVSPDQVWVATTDADSRVPPDWLLQHLALAEQGVSLLIGTVQPDGADLGARRLRAWFDAHRLGDGHGHVFGANLGVRADVYDALGGFPGQDSGEDVALVQAAKAHGVRWRATDACRVLTSGRLHGRARGGFADYLAAALPP